MRGGPPVQSKNIVAHEKKLSMTFGQGEVPEGEYIVPLGKAEVRKEGSDVTIVAWSLMVHKALAAAATLAKEGIKAEVLDLRTLAPLDKDAILKSVGRTRKLFIVHEAVKTSGFGGEISAIVAEEGFDLLGAPIKRVAAPNTPIPFSRALESAFMPNEEKIISAVKTLF
jgi:pyruvate/2-oxoglutarate/acetoin dehydrogenase E1 component